MKIEFHYYITHLVAARAGFRGDDLRILAHAGQLTDDNDKDDFNEFSGFWDPIIPNIGHADAKTMPDQPRLVWDDERLVNSTVNNKERFLDAAGYLFEKLRKKADPKCSKKSLTADRSSLLADLDTAIGSNSKEVQPCKKRLAMYSELATKKEYGETEIPKYRSDLWFNAAVKKGFRYVGTPSRGNRRGVETFDIKPGFETSDWFNFQEAVTTYAERTKAILCETADLAAEYGV